MNVYHNNSVQCKLNVLENIITRGKILLRVFYCLCGFGTDFATLYDSAVQEYVVVTE